MSKAKLAFIWSPCPDRPEAVRLGRALVEERLIACANILPAMDSIFIWQGDVHEAQEAGLLCKTSTKLLPAATQRLADLHTYDTPVVAGWTADETAPESLAWLGDVFSAGAGE